MILRTAWGAYSLKTDDLPSKNEEFVLNDGFISSAAIWTRDVARAHRVADGVNAGVIWVNAHHRNARNAHKQESSIALELTLSDCLSVIVASSPWGGMGDSGIGRENGTDAFHEYTTTKSASTRKPNPLLLPLLLAVSDDVSARVSVYGRCFSIIVMCGQFSERFPLLWCFAQRCG